MLVRRVLDQAWISPLVSHVGAGSDSFHEIALKAYILLGEEEYHDVFQEAYGQSRFVFASSQRR